MVGCYSEGTIQLPRESFADLINGGNMSTCWADEVWGNKLPEGEFAPEYYTGRGEKIEDNAPRFDDSIFDYLSKENNEEYAYIWTVNNEWKCFKMNQFNDAAPEKVAILPVELSVTQAVAKPLFFVPSYWYEQNKPLQRFQPDRPSGFHV